MGRAGGAAAIPVPRLIRSLSCCPGRLARTRGLALITTDLLTRAGALNWARLAVLGLDHDQTSWALRAT